MQEIGNDLCILQVGAGSDGFVTRSRLSDLFDQKTGSHNYIQRVRENRAILNLRRPSFAAAGAAPKSHSSTSPSRL